MAEGKGSETSLGVERSRFVPAPFSPPAGETESEATWGFSDTRFVLDDRGVVRMTGSRYLSSGQDLPSLVPWVRDVMQIDVNAKKKHDFAFPPSALPEPKKNDAFLAALAGMLGAEQISLDGITRLRHGHGHTQEEMYAVKYGTLGRIPDAVVFPENEKQVHALVQAAVAHDVCLIPYGGGTNVSEALRCPDAETRMIVSVDMRRMNQVLWIDPVNRMACIEAGAVGRHLTEQLRRQRLHHGPRARQHRVLDAGRLDRHPRLGDEEEQVRKHRGHRPRRHRHHRPGQARAPHRQPTRVDRRRSQAVAVRLGGSPRHHHERDREAVPAPRGAALRVGPLPRLRVGRRLHVRARAARRLAGQRAPRRQPPVPVRHGAQAEERGLEGAQERHREVLRHQGEGLRARQDGRLHPASSRARGPRSTVRSRRCIASPATTAA